MKVLSLLILLCLNSCFLLFGQCPTSYSITDFPANNNNGITRSGINTEHFTCNEEISQPWGVSGSSGFDIAFSYSIESGSYPTTAIELFSIWLVDQGTQGPGEMLLSVSIKGRQVLINKLVMHKPCDIWQGEYCTTWQTPTYGQMTYSTWDDDFLESTSGWINLIYTDNRTLITYRPGPGVINEKRDFNYNGLNLSAIVEKANASGKELMLDVNPKNGIEMTDMAATFGDQPYDPDTKISELINGNENLPNDRSPKTNLAPGGSSSARVASGEKERVIDVYEIAEEQLRSGLVLYPNPSDGIFNISLSLEAAGEVSYQVLDLSGRALFGEVLTLPEGNSVLQLNKDRLLKQGMYFVDITAPGLKDTRRIVVK